MINMKICEVCGNVFDNDIIICLNCENENLKIITKISVGNGKFNGEYET